MTSTLRLDDCSHCACVTTLSGYTRESAIEALERGELGCWNCEDQDEDNHMRCVVLYDDDEVVWDGRCGPMTRVSAIRRERDEVRAQLAADAGPLPEMEEGD